MTTFRLYPLVDISDAEIGALVAPALDGRRIAALEWLGGGLINTLVRVALDDGGALVLRLFGGADGAFARETAVLARARGAVPAPEILIADDSGARFPRPYAVLGWIEGIQLNVCRKQVSRDELLGLAAPLGELAAGVARLPPAPELPGPPVVVAEVDHAGLGEATAAGLAALLAGGLPDGDATAHGDFLGRNILVAPGARGWRITGLIDWELAFRGSPLWDVGQLFHYPGRYSPAFQARFADGYRAAGGALPDDWQRRARIADAARTLKMLAEPDLAPETAADCRWILEGLVAELGL